MGRVGGVGVGRPGLLADGTCPGQHTCVFWLFVENRDLSDLAPQVREAWAIIAKLVCIPREARRRAAASTTPAQLAAKVSHIFALSIGAAPAALSAVECSGVAPRWRLRWLAPWNPARTRRPRIDTLTQATDWKRNLELQTVF